MLGITSGPPRHGDSYQRQWLVTFGVLSEPSTSGVDAQQAKMLGWVYAALARARAARLPRAVKTWYLGSYDVVNTDPNFVAMGVGSPDRAVAGRCCNIRLSKKEEVNFAPPVCVPERINNDEEADCL